MFFLTVFNVFRWLVYLRETVGPDQIIPSLFFLFISFCVTKKSTIHLHWVWCKKSIFLYTYCYILFRSDDVVYTCLHFDTCSGEGEGKCRKDLKCCGNLYHHSFWTSRWTNIVKLLCCFFFWWAFIYLLLQNRGIVEIMSEYCFIVTLDHCCFCVKYLQKSIQHFRKKGKIFFIFI